MKTSTILAFIIAVIVCAFLFVLLIISIIVPLRVTYSNLPNNNTQNIDNNNLDFTPDFNQEIVVEGLSKPWDIGFLPDRSFIFSQKDGQVSRYSDGKTALLTTISDTASLGEGGLMGLAVDPAFSSNRYIYLCLRSNITGTIDIRVSRYMISADFTKLEDRKDIVTGMPANSTGRHSGCQLEFGPDGNLWIGTGDVAAGTNPMDPKSLGGKILRVDREGKAANGNLSDPFDPRIFSYGHRNVQGLAFFDNPNNAGVYGYSSEHGPNINDEVNPLIKGNFGWDPVPGYNEGVSMTDKVKFPDSIESIWSSGSPTIATSGITIIKGDVWGNWKNRVAVAALKGSQVRLLELSANGKLVSEETLFLNTYGRIRTIQYGPDDKLYLLTDNGGGQDKIVVVSVKK